MIHYRPKKIYIDPAVQNASITQNILKKFPDVPSELVEGKPNFVSEIDQFSDPLLEGKKRLWITTNKGKLLKKCGASTSSLSNMVCCNYFILDFSFNCHFECTYCFLQEYTNLPMMVVYANIEEMLGEVQKVLDSTSSKNIRIGTGEMADSLALDLITGYSEFLVPFFAKQDKALLEFKTKSSCIDHLLKLDPNGQTVVSWSINPQSIVDEFEFKTSSLKERLTAAKACIKAGYKVAFHLDPLISVPNWKREYEALIDQIYSEFTPLWISLGALRFNNNLKTIAQKRFPGTKLTTGEFISSADGKKRYLRPIREEMYQTLKSKIEQTSSKTPVYLCMETETVWKSAMGYVPKTAQQLEGQIVSISAS
jgi:spore photoproduct lyase